MENLEKFDFLPLVESDDEVNTYQMNNTTEAQMHGASLQTKVERNKGTKGDILALMTTTNSEHDEGDNEKDKICFEHVKENFHLYSKKKLEPLSHILIDAYLSTCEDKDNQQGEYGSPRTENQILEIINQYLQKEVSDLNSSEKQKNVKNHVHMAFEESVKTLSEELNCMTSKNEAPLKEFELTKAKLEHTMRWT